MKTPYERYLAALRVGDSVTLGGIAFGENPFAAKVASIKPLTLRFREPHTYVSREAAAEEGYIDPWMIQGPSWLYGSDASARLTRMNKRPNRASKR